MAKNYNVVTATVLGAVLDCDLTAGAKIGGGTPTDNSAVLTNFMSVASQTSPRSLTIDAGSGVLAGITTPAGHVDIEGLGWDTGLFSMVAAHASRCINNGAPFGDPGGTPPTRTPHFRLRNLKVDGNRRANGKTDGSGNWIFSVDLANIERLLLENLYIYDSPTYGVRISNCGEIVVQGCRIESPANTGNTDGIHFDGPCDDIRISDCSFTTGDDAIALNCPEGYGGSIARAVVSNCVFDRVTAAMRVYTGVGSAWTAQQIEFSNCVGSIVPDVTSFINAVFILGYNGPGASPEAIRDLNAANCTFKSVGPIAYVLDDIGILSFSNFVWDSPTNTTPWLLMDSGGAAISTATFNNCRIRRTAEGSANAFAILAAAAGSIGKVVINGFDVENAPGTSAAAIPYLIDMANLTIGELYIESLNPTNITALVNPTTGFTGITKIDGPGLSSCSFEVPDALVPNGTMFISNTTPNAGKLCVKNASGVTIPIA